MQLIIKFNKGFRFSLCVIDIYSKYAWVVPLKDKKGVSIVIAFQSVLKTSNRKPNKIWVDQGSEFYNRSMKSWLEKNDIEMYSTYNEGKSVVAERFIRTLKNKIYKHMTSISKNMYIDKLEVDGAKYLIISSENGDTMQKYQEVFDVIKEIIKKINDYSQPVKYDDNYMKIKFNT